MKELEQQLSNLEKDRKARDEERARLNRENEEIRVQLRVREGVDKERPV